MFQVYEQQASKKLQPLNTLRTIWRFCIINDETRRLIGEAKSFGAANVGLSYTEYSRGEFENSNNTAGRAPYKGALGVLILVF